MWNHINKNLGMQYVCISSDEKRTDVPNGSILLEMDTGTFYLFNEAKNIWEPQAKGGGGGGGEGTTDHTKLTAESRAMPDQHPIGAITGLRGELDKKVNTPVTEGTAGQVLTNDGAGGTEWSNAGGSQTAVLYTEQKLEPEQKEQARKNIAANGPEVTKTMQLVYGVNRLDPDARVKNARWSPGDGEQLVKDYSYYKITASAGDVLRAKGPYAAQKMVYVVPFNEDGVELQGAVNVTEYLLPVGTTYCYVTFYNEYLDGPDSGMLVVNKNYPPEYVPYEKPHYVASTEFLKSADVTSLIAGLDIDGQTNFKEEYMQRLPENLIDPIKCEIGVYINPVTGNAQANSSYYGTDYIPVTPGERLYVYQKTTSGWLPLNGRSFAAYNADKTVIAGAGGNIPDGQTDIEIKPNVSYVRVCLYYIPSDVARRPEGNAIANRPGLLVIPQKTDNGRYVLREDKLPGYETKMFLPKEICVAVGRTIELYNAQVCLQINKYHPYWTCKIGRAFAKKFSVVGDAPKETEATLTLYSDNVDPVETAKTTIRIVEDTLQGVKNIVPIGDSLTNGKSWLTEVQQLSGNKIKFIGTRKTGDLRHEGRSGWSAMDYTSNSEYTFDSNYSGNPDVSGASNPFWNGTKFSLKHYVDTQSTFAGNPDAVMIWLGTNDLLYDPAFTVDKMTEMVNTIKAEFPTMPIFVCNTIYKSNQNGYYSQGADAYAGTIGFQYGEDYKIMKLQKALTEAVGSVEGVHMIPLSICMDRENDFGRKEVPVNPRLPDIKTYIPLESVHPQEAGYMQIADLMYGHLIKYLA